MSLLQIENLGLTYRLGAQTFHALKKVDLHIQRGEMVAILGPSGSGKSTLLYILGCLLKPTSGLYRFAGQDVNHLDRSDLADLRSRSIGFVFQQFHLLPRANVLDNVLLGAQYNQRDTRTESEVRARALELIELVGLGSHIHHLPNQLSGGQQQRVAIARALINDPDLILADEPTGNLDSKSASQILDLLQSIHRTGRTVLIITHDQKVADRCERLVTILDGTLDDRASANSVFTCSPVLTQIEPVVRRPEAWTQHLASATQNLLRNKVRSFLTMIGVMIGIAAVLSTITLGDFTRSKIMESYESLGVNKLTIRAYKNWRAKAKDIQGPSFEGVNQESDVLPMRRLFPEIRLVSPVVSDWLRSAQFGGKSDDQVNLALGVNDQYFTITRRNFLLGHPFSQYHVRNHSPVCVIGFDIAHKLFEGVSPVGRVLDIQGQSDKSYSCYIMGVMASQTSNNEWYKPNEQVIVPDTYLSIMAGRWNSKVNELDVQMEAGASAEDLSTKIKQFLNLKYGKSVRVSVDSDELLVAQMRRFLNLFTMLLAGVAFISLAVGGIGITNMMLVSVTERFKEIGLRKALGARDVQIRRQFLVESIILCLIAGLSGIAAGIIGYHTVLYLSSQLFPKIHFEWVFNFPAMAVAVISILAVGVASGIAPAVRAEKLEVVEALRSE